MTSTPCSRGGSHATLREEHVEARMPRLDGGSGGLAVRSNRLSDLAVRMKALTMSLLVLSGSEISTISIWKLDIQLNNSLFSSNI